MKKYIKSAVADLSEESRDAKLLTAIHSIRPEQLEELSHSPVSDIRIAVAENPNTSVSTLKDLVSDTNYWVRYAIAKNPNAPIKLINMAVKSLGESLTWDIYSYYSKLAESTDPKILTKLSDFRDYRVRRQVASNPNTPVDVLYKLALDEDSDVVDVAVSNPSMPEESLAQLATSGDEYARYCVAHNPDTPAYILDTLADDDSLNVRAAVARNRNTSKAALQRLASDPSEYVCNLAWRSK